MINRQHLTRRNFLQYAGSGLVACQTATQTGPKVEESGFFTSEDITEKELESMRKLARDFMQRNEVPGLSIAVSYKDKLAYTDGFGFAEKLGSQKITHNSLFRIASISKPITSVAVFRLIEQGKLKLDDMVFGDGSLLGTEFGLPLYKDEPAKITLDHLLTHTSGGWENNDGDPMFRQQQMNQRQLISWTIKNRPLDNPPGEKWAYSNFGYCLIGRIIEKVTGRPYADHVKEEILSKCGITDMRIAGSLLSQRAPNEVVYYGEINDGPYWMNVSRMDSHGGWIATPTDLVNFLMRVDGDMTVPDILKPESLKTMTTATPVRWNYGRGWNVNRMGNVWHSGSLPGTTTIAVRTRIGLNWAAFCNTRKSKTNIAGELDRLMWNMVRYVNKWQV